MFRWFINLFTRTEYPYSILIPQIYNGVLHRALVTKCGRTVIERFNEKTKEVTYSDANTGEIIEDASFVYDN